LSSSAAFASLRAAELAESFVAGALTVEAVDADGVLAAGEAGGGLVAGGVDAAVADGAVAVVDGSGGGGALCACVAGAGGGEGGDEDCAGGADAAGSARGVSTGAWPTVSRFAVSTGAVCGEGAGVLTIVEGALLSVEMTRTWRVPFFFSISLLFSASCPRHLSSTYGQVWPSQGSAAFSELLAAWAVVDAGGDEGSAATCGGLAGDLSSQLAPTPKLNPTTKIAAMIAASLVEVPDNRELIRPVAGSR
jgi:hypothetical protein